MWPLSRYPEILPKGEAFVRSWGVPSIFIGRFFGPLRASVPLAAGIFEMPYWSFQAANFVSALVWSAALLLFGDVIAKIMEWLWRVICARSDRRWTGIQAAAGRVAQCRTPRREVGRSDRPSRALQAGRRRRPRQIDDETARRCRAFRGQHVCRLCRFRGDAERTQRTDGATGREADATVDGRLSATPPARARKVERIYNWVARNIRYVGIGFEDGGWTSQPASAVLASRYGDCKAHATLLKASACRPGHRSQFCRGELRTRRYTLTEVATPNFDHAIVYVPEIDQYLDPTASLFAFGTLPPNLAGKPVLNVDKGTLGRIPMAGPERFRMAAETDYVARQ